MPSVQSKYYVELEGGTEFVTTATDADDAIRRLWTSLLLDLESKEWKCDRHNVPVARSYRIHNGASAEGFERSGAMAYRSLDGVCQWLVSGLLMYRFGDEQADAILTDWIHEWPIKVRVLDRPKEKT